MIHFRVMALMASLILFGCAGMKVENPNKPNTKGTRVLKLNDGKVSFAETYTCSLVAGNGKRVYGTKETEAEARQEAVAKCHDATAISFCKPEKASCEKN